MSRPDRVALVTGASGNLGRALVRALCPDHRLVLIDRKLDRLRQTFRDLDPEASHLLAADDLASFSSGEAIAASALERFGRVDSVLHTVGAYRSARLTESNEENFRLLYEVNVLTTANIFAAGARAMASSGGAMVVVSAVAALAGEADEAAYAGTKAAVVRLVESAAEELGPLGISVNAVLPGAMDTPANRASGASTQGLVALDDVAKVIRFLASPDGRGVQGAAIPVQGPTRGKP